jgi:hypothetical protein
MTIVATLREHGQNRSLGGRDRRVREMAGDRGHDDEYAQASRSAPTADKRRSILDDITEACEDGRHDEAHEHVERLREHDRDDDEDDGEMRSRESRERKLKRWARSLIEGSETSRRRAQSVARTLLGG